MEIPQNLLARDLIVMNKLDYTSHNWLAYKINNRVFSNFQHLFVGRVLDLGCGNSQYRQDIKLYANEYIGVDWENSLHDQSNVDVFADICDRLPFEDGYADTIVSFQVMEHLPEPDKYLGECFRILRPGGTIFITVPFMWHIHEAPYDYYRYTRYGLEYLLGKHGFVEIRAEETSGFWQMMVLKFNYHTVRFARGLLRLFWIPIWWVGQVASPKLDKIDPHPEEAASYSVLAKKPDVD